VPPPNPLERYNAKRDFARTGEPKGTVGKANKSTFIIQKHDATRLHWDLRLEIDGVLKSWAVTRGPSLDPDDKRLAVRTEDHPLAYATFEGTIPAKEYGGGTVMMWDRGTWAPIPGKNARDLDKGHLHFTLTGQRMKGEWMLIRLKPRGKEKGENWLLRKVADAHAGGSDDLVERGLTSVATGRTMEEIAKGKPVALPRKGCKVALPKFRTPQLAMLVDGVPGGSGWLHEVKYDGYRAQVAVASGRAKVFTRTGLDWTDRFASIAEAAGALPVSSALIDGEIVALDDAGKPSFARLQSVLKKKTPAQLTLFAFDLLDQDGDDLTKLTNVERKARLRALLPTEGPIAYAEHIVGAGEKLFEAMCSEGYEGVISKRADAPYVGKRTQAWLKIKCTRRQEFVVIGWAESVVRTRGFKSLLLGLNEDGKLRYAGKVGSGFDVDTMAELRATLDDLTTDMPPAEVPRAVARGAHWVRPERVAEIAFAEFTSESVVRHASFVALRDDKKAKYIHAEQPALPPQPASFRITNADRVIFPGDGITKLQLANYYAAVFSVMLPWIADRPVSLVRCPQGRAKKCFFQKHDAGSFGDAVHKVAIREKDGSTKDYLWIDGVDGLMACVQMGSIEVHGWGSRASDVERPDRMVFDLDPDAALTFADVCKAAIDIKDQLADLGLVSFAMLSGGKGIHVVVPLKPHADWSAVKDFASRFAQALSQAEPERFVATMSKTKRERRIFIDWLRNQRGSTAALPYTVRARPGAPVAVPVGWAELREIDSAAQFKLGDVSTLIERAASQNLVGWGLSTQRLPAY
jgi:bifunctional non-homologous end joining protein LigD